MTVWQHAWISVDPTKAEDITKLEAFGKEGWELVSVMPWGQAWQFEKAPHLAGDAEHATLNQAGASIFLMFFKRPVEDNPNKTW